MKWKRSRIGARSGRKISRVEFEWLLADERTGHGYATIEPGRDTGWWYWRVVIPLGERCGQATSLEAARKQAESVIPREAVQWL